MKRNFVLRGSHGSGGNAHKVFRQFLKYNLLCLMLLCLVLSANAQERFVDAIGPRYGSRGNINLPLGRAIYYMGW